ncbi:DUF4837 family protein [Flavobacteriaceae bacterium F08102]|nr:DUF4837 family protein [Flavobacteriaceae bacterium F08102]
MKTSLLTAFLVITLISCGDKNAKPTLTSSSGRINHLTIVMDNDLWKGNVGDSLRDIIAEPLLGLPQEETQFSITQVPPQTFGKLFKNNRNLLIIGLGDKNGFGMKSDVYASPQIVMNIRGTDEEQLIAEIKAHRDHIIDTYRESDLKMYQKKITYDHWNSKDIKTLTNFGVDLKIPRSYAKVDDTGDFIWFRKEISKGSMNLIAYALPLTDRDSIANNIAKERNAIGKKYIPGQFDGTYMITEAAYTPYTNPVDFNGFPAFETRGKWEVKDDFMAGPFLNYTIIDEPNNRVLVFEGFTYAPSIKKRDYMFELEAIIKTLKI